MIDSVKRSTLTIGLLVACLVAAGCATVYQDKENATIARRTYHPDPQNKKHRENYVQVRAKGKKTPHQAFARFGQQLFAPFKMGVTMGVFDPKAHDHSLNQQGCVELDVPGSDPLEFAAFCGFMTSLTGTWSMTVGYNLGSGSGQSSFVDLNNAGDRVKMKVESDALSVLSFYAKPIGAIDWTTIFQLDAGALGYDFAQMDVVPGLGAASLNPMGEMGFSGFWGNSAPRPNPTDEEVVLDHALTGIKFNIKGIQGLDDLNPDAPTVLDRLDNAILNYQLAHDHLEATLPDTKENRKAHRYLESAIRFTDKAIDKTQDGKWNAAIKMSGKAAKQGDKAAGIYLAIPLNF